MPTKNDFKSRGAARVLRRDAATDDFLDYSSLPQRETLDGRQLLQRKLFLLQRGQRVENVRGRSGKVGLAQ